MAVGFDASGDRAYRTTNLPSITLFTVCGFARLKTERDWHALFSLDDASSNYIQLALDDTTPPRQIVLSEQSIPTVPFASRPTNDTWFFFAITRNGTGTENTNIYWTYLDPVSMVTAAGTPTGTTTPTSYNLGNDGFDDWGGVHLAHVRCWDAELSQSELESEAASGAPVRSSNLRYYHPLANNTDTGDDSGNGYDLTFSGTLTTETDPPLAADASLVIPKTKNLFNFLLVR